MSIKINKAEVLTVVKDTKFIAALSIAIVTGCADVFLRLGGVAGEIERVVTFVAPPLAFWIIPSPKDKLIASRADAVANAALDAAAK